MSPSPRLRVRARAFYIGSSSLVVVLACAAAACSQASTVAAHDSDDGGAVDASDAAADGGSDASSADAGCPDPAKVDEGVACASDPAALHCAPSAAASADGVAFCTCGDGHFVCAYK